MTNELREYIQHKYNCNISVYGTEVMDDGVAVPCSCGLAQALATAESDMEKLKTDIEQAREQARDGYIEEAQGRLDAWDRGYLAAMRFVLDHIRTEFLGEER